MNDSAQKIPAEFELSLLELPLPSVSYLPNQAAAPKTKLDEKHIVFCLGGKYFAVSSSEVSEVAQALAITPLPNVPAWLLGIAELRGKIISVVSGQKLFVTPAADYLSKTKYIVLQSPNSSSTVALAVEKLNEIIVSDDNKFQPVRDEQTPYLRGKTMYQTNALNLIDVEKLFSALTI